MGSYKIAIIEGDGIGKEVMAQALRILCELEQLEPEISFQLEQLDWSSDYYLEHGRMMPENWRDILMPQDAILFGAIGDARVKDEVTIWELIMPIRKEFRQYINYRPVQSLPNIASPLEDKTGINFSIFRENAEGEYSNSGGRMFKGEPSEMAIQNTIMTRTGIERITRAAGEYARKHGKCKVTCATKSNAIIHTNTLWDECVERVMREEFPELELESYYIDALAAYFVQRPKSFEVVLASNLFGDILSDLGSGIVGGLGLSPSGNINPEKDYPSMFEPVHGSAPDIAGLGIANPIAQIWSAALLLEHIGETEVAGKVINAIQAVLEENRVLTKDIGGQATTEEMGTAIIEKLNAQYT
ncbi:MULTISPECIES: isocitrate/isopropylmalate dehydrogenase family protein [unclassified Planococcus (in: firmicutes)]|uniref:isocitrate/isopropylmalate dehydrogenase family protein n=1 Tax=unclassified Planococcus (in: firmicutes) TaxID=2662419 RepID=UPI000C31E65A|nr:MULTISPECIES: isocitrate/isopropylmalate family dehydrogenase [unclassified Planococcus (in: firmicutes)]AUD13056.1 tartrate dehydrogenase [Planococcus sp. MB-3u-03]PKG45461.1 tartrate dehydrogenase [Planococcus sp. Urea-trap-24]PKG88942.1 tartrate dehydrogenase [Planococcus sp. Urea-3u-39]PKH36310.1 tartrate dehydrogenase [Planococcus sp. MB-3u-09]